MYLNPSQEPCILEILEMFLSKYVLNAYTYTYAYPPPCLCARSWRVVFFRRVVLPELPTGKPFREVAEPLLRESQ